jgi:murein DD-endopeptidase MepM/ murein hydrolase activator NlpD
VLCKAAPGAVVRAQGLEVAADSDGWAMFGLRRDAPESLAVSIRLASGETVERELAITARNDAFRVIRGLDCDKVDARTSEQKAHAARSWVKKQDAFAEFNDGAGALEGFLRPAQGRPSSPFGPARKYVGVSAETGEPCEKVSVHRGYDIAAPVGTPVIAPAAGKVILADPDLYYEGGTIFLDHGHGLVSVFMHLSKVDVAEGDVVEAGEKIADVGNTGRTTGPHLHWAVKWRHSASSDRSADFYIDPALLLDLAPVHSPETAPATADARPAGAAINPE